MEVVHWVLNPMSAALDWLNSDEEKDLNWNVKQSKEEDKKETKIEDKPETSNAFWDWFVGNKKKPEDMGWSVGKPKTPEEEEKKKDDKPLDPFSKLKLNNDEKKKSLKAEDASIKLGGSGGAGRKVTMNLEIKNYFQIATHNMDSVMQKVKQTVTDVVVDAARDGSVISATG